MGDDGERDGKISLLDSAASEWFSDLFSASIWFLDSQAVIVLLVSILGYWNIFSRACCTILLLARHCVCILFFLIIMYLYGLVQFHSFVPFSSI